MLATLCCIMSEHDTESRELLAALLRLLANIKWKDYGMLLVLKGFADHKGFFLAIKQYMASKTVPFPPHH